MMIVGDIGGTHARLALADGAGRVSPARQYESHRFASFHEVARRFVAETGAQATQACFAVAGPVVDGRIRTTNLPWLIDAHELETELRLERVLLVNDFYAQALAVTAFRPDDWVEVRPGAPVPGGPIAVLGAGTGLGEAFLVHAAGRYQVLSSEGGHVEFGPADELQIELLRWLRERISPGAAASPGAGPVHVSYERILSGAGLVALYGFMRDRGFAPEQPHVAEALQQGDAAAAISRFALAHEDRLSDAALDLFFTIYGQEAGNLGLKVLAGGGVYLCGGIAPRNLARLREADGPFQRAFAAKGRLSAVLEQVPVRVVTNPQAGLIGAAVAGLRG